jgi:hypothetical protein
MTNDNEKDPEFTPEALYRIANAVGNLRLSFLFETEDTGRDRVAEQHFLLGLSLLEQAQCQFKLAMLAQPTAHKAG